MKITPLDIQQMVFKTGFRGYDKEEVNRFLEEIAETVEELNRENAVQREKITFLEQQLVELKRTEVTLSNTLVSAQSLAEDVKRSAQRESELVIKEAELKAGEMIRQARVELSNTQRDLSVLQKQRLLMVERLRATLRTWKWRNKKPSKTVPRVPSISSRENRALHCERMVKRSFLCALPSSPVFEPIPVRMPSVLFLSLRSTWSDARLFRVASSIACGRCL
jgi:cell division initiation protein